MPSKSFLDEIQSRLGDEATEDDAIKACEFLESIFPISAEYRGTDVPTYLKECAEVDYDIQNLHYFVHTDSYVELSEQDKFERSNKLWAEMVKHVYGI